MATIVEFLQLLISSWHLINNQQIVAKTIMIILLSVKSGIVCYYSYNIQVIARNLWQFLAKIILMFFLEVRYISESREEIEDDKICLLFKLKINILAYIFTLYNIISYINSQIQLDFFLTLCYQTPIAFQHFNPSLSNTHTLFHLTILTIKVSCSICH